jgi:antitoxin component YwqK of YwqJK toxin-antitoxin module
VIRDSLALYEDGKLKRGVVAAAKTFGDVEVREGDWITLYPSGALNRLELSGGPRALKGYPCKGSENYFHENGQLKKCTLGELLKRGGEELQPGTLLCFDESGQPKEPCGMMTP